MCIPKGEPEMSQVAFPSPPLQPFINMSHQYRPFECRKGLDFFYIGLAERDAI